MKFWGDYVNNLAGNDTIDPYPLFPKEAEKILIIKKDIFKEISSWYQLFRQSFENKQIKVSERPKLSKDYSSKDQIQRNTTRHFSRYEPSNKEYINDYNWRRWVRVKEWFHEFGPDAEKFERTILIQ